MNRGQTRTETAGQLSEKSVLHGRGLESIPRVTTKCTYQLHHDDDDESGNKNEPNPHDAHDLIEQARRTWAELDSATAFCEVPATAAGLIAIEQLISEGISVKVVKLFGLRRYQQVLAAYIAGMEARLAQGKPVRHVASIANLSVNSVDALINPILEKFIAQDSEPADLAEEVQGNIANAINTLAHQINRETFGSERFQQLVKQGARGQCLFVNCDHCGPLSLAAEDVEHAHHILQCLPKLGIELDAISQQLEDAGVDDCEGNDQQEMVLDMSSYITSKQKQPLGLIA